MPSRLPLFPLDMVLFPGTPLPLHIFEPRYRAMLADCLAGDERFGLLPAARDGSTPPPGTVGCVARIRASHQLPDGRSNIVVVGERRFLLRQGVTGSTPYLVGLVDTFDDLPGPEVPPEVHAALREVATSYLDAVETLGGPGERSPLGGRRRSALVPGGGGGGLRVLHQAPPARTPHGLRTGGAPPGVVAAPGDGGRDPGPGPQPGPHQRKGRRPLRHRRRDVSEALRAELARIVGPRWVRSRPAELAAFEADGLPTHAARPALAVLPGTRRELADVMRLLHLADVPFVARGAGTGLSGGALAGGTPSS